jgi:hypothetical protein
MSVDSTRRRWRAAAAVLAVATISHTLYFDWSDLPFFTVLMGICAVSAEKWSRLAATATGVIFLTVLTAHLMEPDLSDWPEAQGVAVGQKWSSVLERLGSPTHEAATAAAARPLISGYSAPSPFRYRHQGPVAVFVRGEHALWVFHDGQRVTGTFIGGS